MAAASTNTVGPEPEGDFNLPNISEIGLTVLWTPEDDTETIADVCFVHGLGGHPYKTWRYRAEKGRKLRNVPRWISSLGDKNDESRQTQAEECYWPYDLLKKDFDAVRIMTYGYDSSPSHWYKSRTNQMTIDQHTQTMLQRISSVRANHRKRPIIFVAHSLGGILVKNMIILSGKYTIGNVHLRDISESCHSIAFFGTPHKGATAAEIGTMVANLVGILPAGPSVYKSILRDLQPDSQKIESIMTDFNDILEKNIPAPDKIQIYSFQEGHGYAKINTFDSKVVPDGSSTFNRRAIEQHTHLPANHLDMCRFKSSTDTGYSDFKSALTGYLESLHNSQSNDSGGDASSGMHTGPPNQDSVDVLNSLDFHERTIRRSQIAENQGKKETFQWIWTSPFRDWLPSPAPLFWISGKPASGKSTLMSFLSKDRKLVDTLRSYINEDWVVVHHFFDFRARDTTPNNLSGLLRSSLFQLLWELPESVRQIKGIEKRERYKFETWSLAELFIALDEVLEDASRPVLLLLDGLDEFGGNKIRLCRLVNRILSPRRKVCIASRPDPPFPDAFRETAMLRMDRLNEPGILAFAKEIFLEFWNPSEPARRHEMVKTATELATRAEGVFLWARFAVFEIMEGQTRGEDPHELEARLKAVPPELGEIYMRALSRRSAAEKDIASRLLQLLRYSMIAVTLQEVFVALSLTQSSTPWSFGDCNTPVRSEQLEFFRKRILASCGGVVETVQAQTGQGTTLEYVRLIHRTVESYLDEGGWSGLTQSPVQPHYLWLQAGAKLLQRIDLRVPLSTIIDEDETSLVQYRTMDKAFESKLTYLETNGVLHQVSTRIEIKLLPYILLHLLDHAKVFEELTGISSHTLIADVLSDDFISAHQWAWWDNTCQFCRDLCRDSRPDCFCMTHYRSLGSIRIAIVHGLELFVRDSLPNQGSSTTELWHAPSPALPNLLKRIMNPTSTRAKAVHSSIAELAVVVASLSDAPVHKRVLDRCLQYRPTVGDTFFGLAFRTASPEVLRSLLDKARTSSGELTFKSDVDFCVYFSPRDAKLGKECLIRPLWDVAKRETGLHGQEIIGLLVLKGEDINGVCGPSGTAMHSMVKDVRDGLGREYAPEMLQALLAHGADINVQGLMGTPLEYLWMLANTSTHGKLRYATRYRKPLLDLIEMGAVNSMKDPNGLIPSVERMKSWPSTNSLSDEVTYEDYIECKRYYHEGPRKED